MASHGKRRHVKRLAKPKAVPIPAKKAVYLKKVQPGPHPDHSSVGVGTMLVELLKVAKTAREARTLLRSGAVLVDGRPVRDMGFPVGLMDSVSIPATQIHFRVTFAKGKLVFSKITPENAKFKLCRVNSKRRLSKSKTQLNLHDGRNILVGDGSKYSTGGTLKVSLPDQEILEFLPLSKGATCFVYQGRHSGTIAILEELFERESSHATEARLASADGSAFTTLKNYLLVVGKDFVLAKQP